MLEIKDLHVRFHGSDHDAVGGISLTVADGQIMGLVGESGSGKTVTAMVISGLMPQRRADISGQVLLDGKDLLALSPADMRKRQGCAISVVFQEPMSAMNPVMRIGPQVEEALRVHTKLSPQERRERALQALRDVDLPDAEAIYDKYPHQMFGGMLQRAMIAAAIISRPKLLLADEPTTALDVTVQAQILDLLRDIQRRLHTSTILVSHDLGVVARAADRVAIMYAGRIVEIGTAEEVYYDPRHPYTQGLLRSLPALARCHGALHTIPGMPPTLIDPPEGDAFACRNPQALAIDYQRQPPMFRVSDTHYAATWLLDPRAPKLAPLPEGEEHYV